MVDPFGPLTPFEQINHIANMFPPHQRHLYRPVIGRIIKSFGYDIADAIFEPLSRSEYEPPNIWAYAQSEARKKAFKREEQQRKDRVDRVVNQNIFNKLESLFIKGKISIDEYDAVKTAEEAEQLVRQFL